MTTDVAAVERSVRLALPALVEAPAPGWVVRVSGGTTKRVNSANPTMPGTRLADVRAVAKRIYAAHGQPVRYRLTPLAASDVDTALADTGFAHLDQSWTMIAPLRPHRVDPAVTIEPTAASGWLEGYAGVENWPPPQRKAHAAVLARLPPAGVALLDAGDKPIAWGIAAIGDGRACLFDIAVASGHRRLGLGRRLVVSLLGWAAASGCSEAVLQVLDGNAAARRLYASLGFTDAYPYHYWVAPSR